MKKIVVFASGSGTNAAKIIAFFKDVALISVEKVFCNNPNAGVLQRAIKAGVPVRVFNREQFSKEVLDELKQINPDLIVLAGFLWMIPSTYVAAFPKKIINIHPALLPKYGGKGMYGSYVFQAIAQNGEEETGITIHYVNEQYDEGTIIFQATTRLTNSDTSDEIAKKTHALEHKHFPPTIYKLLKAQ